MGNNLEKSNVPFIFDSLFNQIYIIMIKVRFNLGTGENFRKWQVTLPNGTVKYYEPSEVQLVMFGCFLRNQKGTAQKIFGGANKTVCAWVECQGVDIRGVGFVKVEDGEYKEISYNPRVTPNWDSEGENVDGTDVGMMVSDGRKLYGA
jgi:hypothetical protein